MISIPARLESPKVCKGHNFPYLVGSTYAYEASKQEYEFWNKLSQKDREELTREAYNRCLYEAIQDAMQRIKKTELR